MDNSHFGELPERLRQEWLCESTLASHPTRQTWLVRHRQRGERAVLKIRKSLSRWGRRIAPPEAQLAQIVRHPQIPSFLEWGTLKAGRVFLLESYVDGTAIGRAIEQLSLPEPERLRVAIDWLVDTARLIETLHGHGWTHGDLCPRHVLVERTEQRPNLIDFDCALAIGKASRGHRVRGSLGYAAPAALTGKPAASHDDVFGWGVVAWECLTGRLPWTLQGDMSSYLKQVQTNQRCGAERVSEQVASVLDQALRFESSERPDLRELRQRLLSAVD